VFPDLREGCQIRGRRRVEGNTGLNGRNPHTICLCCTLKERKENREVNTVTGGASGEAVVAGEELIIANRWILICYVANRSPLKAFCDSSCPCCDLIDFNERNLVKISHRW
jgi:hypothetical protein